LSFIELELAGLDAPFSSSTRVLITALAESEFMTNTSKWVYNQFFARKHS